MTTTNRREIRSIAQPMTVRTTADGAKQVSGYAIVFNSQSVDLGGFTEICAPTMLQRTLKENPDVLALRDHNQELLIGRTTAGTLSLKVDSKGLGFTITLPKTQTGDDTAENVRLRNLDGCSFGFTTVNDSWAVDADGNVVRTLLDVDLYEISITSFPAYPGTSAALRSCPPELRKKLNLDPTLDQIIDEDDDGDPDSDDPFDDDQDDDDDDDDEDRCQCRCERCIAGDCDECEDGDCDDDDCDGCPNQDDLRSDHLRIRRLFASRST